MSNPPAGRGLLGWLGRQVGHVAKAVKTDVTATPRVVHREQAVQQQPHPTQPGVVLRRTTTDEVIVTPPALPRDGT